MCELLTINHNIAFEEITGHQDSLSTYTLSSFLDLLRDIRSLLRFLGTTNPLFDTSSLRIQPGLELQSVRRTLQISMSTTYRSEFE